MDSLSKQQAKKMVAHLFDKTQRRKQEFKQKQIYINKYQVSDKFVYKEPYHTNNDHKQTKINFRMYRDWYNSIVPIENNSTLVYNEQVIKYQETKPLSLENYHFIKRFQKTNKYLSIVAYNKKVESTNKHYHKLLLLRKKHYKLTDNNYDSLITLVGFYKVQVFKKTQYLTQQNLPTTRVLEKLSVNYCHWANHHIDGLKAKTKKVRTLQRHVYRLRDAGVIINYQFLGSKSAVYCEINPKIICFSDVKPSSKPLKTQNIEKQNLNSSQDTKCHNISNSNSSSNKKIIKKNIAENLNNLLSEKSNKTLLEHPECNVAKNNTLGRKRKKVAKKKEKNSSEILIQTTLQKKVIAPKLEHKTIDTTPITNEILAYETNYGTLTKQQFIDVIIQQIVIYMFTKLYKNHSLNFYTGVWINAMKSLEDRFINNDYLYNKHTMLKILKKYQNALDYCECFGVKHNKKDWLDPFNFLDKNRIHNYEVGLQFVLNKQNAYQNKLKKGKTNYQLKTQKQTQQATHRKHKQKLKWAILKYRNGNYTYNQLNNYVTNNIPMFLSDLSKFIKII